ncbi:MAG: PIN domain-containing protein [Pirellulaceae bacterium]
MENEPVLVDTGPLIALYESKDLHHNMCREQAKLLPVGKAYTCWPVLTEAAYRLRRYPVKRSKLFQAVRDEIYVLLPLGARDMVDIEAVFQTYHDQEVDLADACLVHLANREQITKIFTLDRRHFGVYRMANGRPFELLPH